MPSQYSPDLRIELIANGEQSGTWGTTTNTNLGTIIEDAISGLISVSVGPVNIVDGRANYALTAFNGAEDQARRAVVSLSTTTSANFNVYVPPVTKLYVMRNTSIYIATVYCSQTIGNTTPAGTGISIPAGKTVLIRSDGTNIVEQLNHVVGDISTGGSLTVDDGGSVGGSATVGGDITLRGAVSVREPIFSYSTAYLGTTNAIQILQNATNINVTDNEIVIASPLLVNGTAVMLSSTDTLPGGLNANQIYYVINTNRTRYYTAYGSISGTTLTIDPIIGVQAGSIGPDSTVTGTGVTSGTTVGVQLTFDPATSVGGKGTYSVNNSQTVASTRISGEFSTGAQTIQLATSRTSPTAVEITAIGDGTLTIVPIALANTPPVGSSTEAIATTAFVNNAIVTNNQILQSVKAATTENITLSGLQTIDGVTTLVAGDRVLVKDQFVSSQTPTFNATTETITVTTAPSNDTKVMFTNSGGALPTGLETEQIYYVINRTATTFQVALAQDGAVVAFSSAGTGTTLVGNVPSSANGIYIVNAGAWTRATDANTSAEIAAAQVAVTAGTKNGGKQFVTRFKSTNTFGSATMEWNEIIDGPATANALGGLRVTVSGTTLNLFTYL